MENFFKNYKKGFEPYKLDVSSAYEYDILSVVVKNGEILTTNSKLKTENFIVNLASTSKPFTMDLLTKSMKEDKFIATKDLIKELIFRKQYQHILENPDYKDVIVWLEKNKISNLKSKLRARFKGNDVGLYNWKAEDFPEISIDLEELCFNALTLSSNSAIEIARNKLEEVYGSDEGIQKALEEFKIAPTLELHKGGFKLLNQPRANSGDLKDIVLAFDNLIRKTDQRLLNAMKNNPVFFDVGISHFIENNVVYEKTGVAWPVCYGEEYAKLGYPPHMVMGTLFSIKDDNQITSFGVFKVIVIAVPKEVDTNGFPNIYERKYIPYINSVKYKFLNEYRKELIELVNKNSNINLKNNLGIKQLFIDLFKQIVLKLQLFL